MTGAGHPPLVPGLLLALFLAAGAGALPATGPDRMQASRGGAGPYDPYLPLLPNISLTDETHAARDWFDRGFALTNEERYGEAIAAYDRALSYNRLLVNAWYYRGDALARLGRYEEAALAFRNATAVDPDFVDAYFYESLVLGKLGRFRDRQDALGRGLDAADRVKAKGAADAPPGAPGPISQPVSPGTALLGAWIAASLRAILRREKGNDLP